MSTVEIPKVDVIFREDSDLDAQQLEDDIRASAMAEIFPVNQDYRVEGFLLSREIVFEDREPRMEDVARPDLVPLNDRISHTGIATIKAFAFIRNTLEDGTVEPTLIADTIHQGRRQIIVLTNIEEIES